MAEPDADSTEKRVRRLGVATFATLCLQLAGSLVGYVAVSHQHLGRMHAPGGEIIAWMAFALVSGVILCVLVVVYLRHLFRDDTAPKHRVLWTMLIVFLGPFAMAYYWAPYLRRLSHGMA